MKVLHIANLIGSNTNGIDYVVEKILLHQNALDKINVDQINLNNFSYKIAFDAINLNDVIIFHSIFSIKSWSLIFYCLFKNKPYIIFPHSGLTI